jgi:sulfur-carrier protein adenylyltransferase/sulfurtransferase
MDVTEQLKYEDLFERNLGIYSPEEQERIKNGKVVIVGCGGIGGVVALALARSGLENFKLIEFDTFQISNMNRQITCFVDTLGKNKALTVRDAILAINPQANVDVDVDGLKPENIEEIIQQGDVIMPAADDWALSMCLLAAAKDLGKPAVMGYPVGALGRVSTFLPESPYAAECLAMPYKVGYEGLKEFMEDAENRKILQYYQTEGAWRQDWFDGWCDGTRPHAQLCTIVWITGTLAAVEILKLMSGKWKPVVSPRYWHITPTRARIARFSIGRRLLSRISRRRWGKALLPAMAKRPWLVRLFTRLISR